MAGLEKDGTSEGFDPTKPFKTRDGREVRNVKLEVSGEVLVAGTADVWVASNWSSSGKNRFQPSHDIALVNVAPLSPDPHGADRAEGDWQAREGVLLKLQILTDYEPTDAELAALSSEDRGEVKGWRMRGEAMAAGVEALPKEPSREMWAAMGDAYISIHRKHDRAITLNHDVVTGAIYEAIRLTASPFAGSAGVAGVSDSAVEAGR